jgi:acetyl esterase
MNRTACSILLIFLFLAGGYAQVPEKYVPKSNRKKEKYATPEPGTYLKPAAYSILRTINHIMEDSSKIREPAPWMVSIITPHQKKLLDTTFIVNDLHIPARIYYPTKKSLSGNQPVILFFHGGGFVFGSVEQYNLMVSKLARVTGQIIISIDYSLAPEYPFPSAINDCYAAFQWIRQNGPGLGADTARITLMGDSAGGNLATVVTLMCRDRHIPQPCCQVLLYPAVTFLDTEYPSMTYFLKEPAQPYVLSESFLRRVRIAYEGKEGNDLDPYISPLEARLSSNLAPALIITAECDPLRDSQREYAKELEDAGVQVRYLEYSGMIHGFMSFHMILGDAVDAMKKIRDFLPAN